MPKAAPAPLPLPVDEKTEKAIDAVNDKLKELKLTLSTMHLDDVAAEVARLKEQYNLTEEQAEQFRIVLEAISVEEAKKTAVEKAAADATAEAQRIEDERTAATEHYAETLASLDLQLQTLHVSETEAEFLRL